MATRHACQFDYHYPHTSGTGKGPAKCKYCGGGIRAREGSWGVFSWTAENRYPVSAAVKVYQSLRAAEKAAGTEYVVRWIPA